MNWTDPINVSLEWGLSNTADVIMSIFSLVITGFFLYYLYLQVRNSKESLTKQITQLEKYEDELSHRYRMDEFKIVEDTKNILRGYKITINKIVLDYKKNKIAELTSEDKQNARTILNTIEILGLKQEYLRIDIKIIDELLGATIVPIITHTYFKNKIKEIQGENKHHYVYLLDLKEKLVKIQKDGY